MSGEPKMYNSDDIGTRLKHMVDLHDMWSTAYAYLTTDGWHSDLEKSRANELRCALDLLNHHMQAEYGETYYARAINNLPKDIT